MRAISNPPMVIFYLFWPGFHNTSACIMQRARLPGSAATQTEDGRHLHTASASVPPA